MVISVKNKYKLSIIVPVYNTEKYIERCISSILNQEFDNFQLIIINDGSKDNSEKIINKLIKGYDNVIYKKIKNSGVAHARNVGLSYAAGEYIGFVDSDDYIEKDMYAKMYNMAINKKSEIVCCAYNKIMKDNNKEIHPKNVQCFGKSLLKSKNILFNSNPYITQKIFKRELLSKNNILFDEDLRIFEDLLFSYKLFLLSNKIYYVDECLYNYSCENETSLTRKFTEKMFDAFPALERLINFYRSKYNHEFDEALEYISVRHITLRYYENASSRELKNKFINEAFKFLNSNFKNHRRSKAYVGKKGFVSKYKFLVKLYLFIKRK